MLQHLSIRNIVLIESCDIAFEGGLCVLTGETGAGKSILLDALGLVLGERADARLIRHGETQSSVAAEFDIAANANAKTALSQLGIDSEDTLYLRRNLTSDGKTRCFINDQPVSVNALKSVGETLIEIHGQHEQRGLLDPSSHLTLLDAFGRIDSAPLAAAYTAWKFAESELAALKETIAQAEREEDYLRHMQKELAALAPEAGEEATLADNRAVMMQGEKLASLLSDVESELTDGKSADSAIATALRLLVRSPLGANDRFAKVIEPLDRAGNELAEALQELDRLREESRFDEGELERMEERLFGLRAAARKYGTSVDGLAVLLAETEQKLSTLSSQQQNISALESRTAKAREHYSTQAESFSKKRKTVAAKMEKALLAELLPLKMGNVKFRVAFEALAESAWSARGMESVRFEAATNVAAGSKDIPYAPLTKIASGGELSRFMLALKVVLSDVKSTPTFIFDEIDTGTGGAVADAIGARLAVLGESAQVLVVTHLPQVAARGSQHLRIEKREQKKAVFTTVETLPEKERKEELARMLAGSTITDEARRAAQKLLAGAQ